MTTLLFANNAASTLASGISPSATTVQLAAGTGGLFPNPTSGQGFFATITDAATQEVREIVLCGTRTGDAIPVVRAQQGTTAETWNAGDIFSQLNTAGDMEGMVQPDQLQQNTYGHAIDVGGTVNSITATLPGGLTALVDGMTFNLTAAGANTGAATLTLTLGSTLQSAHPIQKFGSSGLNAGDIPESGFVMSLTWSATLGCYQINNPASGTAGSVVGGATNDLLVQTAPSTTGFVPAPTVAGAVLAFIGGVIQWAAAAVTSFNGRAGAVAPQTGDYTAAQVGAIPVTAFQAPNLNKANPGYQAIPGPTGAGSGFYVQGGTLSISPNTDTYPSFPHAVPTACVAVVVSCNNQSSALTVDGFTTANFHVRVNANQISYIAFGY